MLCHGHHPSFTKLIASVEEKLAVATNCYGELLGQGNLKEDCSRIERAANDVGRRVCVSGKRTDTYANCGNPTHSIADCQKIIEMMREDKVNRLLNKGLRFNYLLVVHQTAKCPTVATCSHESCGGKHHTLMHIIKTAQPSRAVNVGINTVVKVQPKCYSGFVPVRIIGPNRGPTIYALLDNGSDTALISSDIMKHLNISGRIVSLLIPSVNGTITHRSEMVDARTKSIDGAQVSCVQNVHTIAFLPVKKAYAPSTYTLQQRSHLKDIELRRLRNRSIDMLIDANKPGMH